MLTYFLPFRTIFSITFSIILLSGCGADFAKMAEERLAYARTNNGDIQIVVIKSLIKTNYIKGVLLAADEINGRPQKLLGRKLKVHIEKEGATFDDGKSTFRSIAANPKIVAVLGHRLSSIAVPVSVIYEQSNIVFLSSFSTIQNLTGHNFEYVFRMIPNATVMAEQTASVAQVLGYEKMVILYGRDDVSRELAFLFEDAAIREKITLIKRSSFSSKEANYRSLISQFSNEKFDAIFIASPASSAGLMVKQLREMGVKQPILGGDTFNDPIFSEIAKEAGDNVIAPSFYKSNKYNRINQDFIDAYGAKHYNETPDYRAAQGYDSLMLLALAIDRAGSTIPSLLASTLHYMSAWVGVTGLNKFSSAGEMLGKKYFFKTWEYAKWQDLPAIHIPYLLERFQAGITVKGGVFQSAQNVKNYTQIFTEAIGEEQYNLNLLELSRKILKFKSLGVIYENNKKGREMIDYDLLKKFSKESGVTLLECHIPLSILTTNEIKQQFFSCFGKLSLSMEVLFLPTYHNVDQKMLQELSRGLISFKIPTISLDQRNSNPNISILLGKRSDINTSNMNDMQIYNGLLNNIKLNVFAKQLKNLPEISINLYELQSYNFQDTAILNLSPSRYFNTAYQAQTQKVIEK